MSSVSPAGTKPGVTDIAMPKLSDSMEEGTVVRWLVPDGSAVSAGQEVVEVETDKAIMPFESDVAGTLRQLADEGATVPVGTPIAQVLAPGADAGEDSPAPADVVAPAPATDAGSPAAAAPAPPGPEVGRAGRRVENVSSIARRVAGRLGVDLGRVQGSGPRGRILKADVVAHREREPAVAPAPPVESAAPVAPEADADPRRVALTRTQELIARRMVEAKTTIPEFTVQGTVDMHACVELRADLKRAAAESAPVPSLNDLVIRAVALALRDHPKLNASFREGHIEYHPHVNVGMAVAAVDTLLVPTVFDADLKRVSQIAADTRRASERARAGTLTPTELSGGTFTVSNLGMAGVDSFTAVINPPQAAILAVGRVSQQPVVDGDQVVIRPQMQLTLSADHRIVYGADAAAFLSQVRANLEVPFRML